MVIHYYFRLLYNFFLFCLIRFWSLFQKTMSSFYIGIFEWCKIWVHYHWNITSVFFDHWVKRKIYYQGILHKMNYYVKWGMWKIVSIFWINFGKIICSDTDWNVKAAKKRKSTTRKCLTMTSMKASKSLSLASKGNF